MSKSISDATLDRWLPRSRSEHASKIYQDFADTFWRRAAAFDRDASFPAANFKDLQRENLLAANVPVRWGGLGLGVGNGNPIGLWAITRAIAFGDPATAQPYHVHTNEIEILSALANPEQQERYLKAVVDDGAVFGGYGSQQKSGRPVKATRDGNGWRLNGDKYFATNAAYAKHALVWASDDTVASDDPLDQVRLFYVRHDQPGIQVKTEWWPQFQGLRATESHQVSLDNLYVDDKDVIASPGDYSRRRVQSRCYAHFAASFLGIADRLLHEQALAVRYRGRENDPLYLRRLGRAKAGIEATWGALERASRAYVDHDPEADTLADCARYIAERTLREAWEDTLDSVGTWAFSDQSGLSKLNRDIPLYVRHENVDNVLQAIADDQLGKRHVNLSHRVVVQ